MVKRAYVYFWDGFRFGPRIITNDGDIEERFVAALNASRDVQIPERVSAVFIALEVAEGRFCVVENAAPARTTGQFVQAAEAAENWPRRDFMGREAFPQAGVFIVNTTTGEVRITGGLGIWESEDETNVGQLREIVLELQEGGSDEVHPDG